MSKISDPWNAGFYDSAHAFVHEMAGGVLDLLDPKPGERILDLGCGTGPLTNKISLSGAEVLGIDASPAMIQQARANFPALKFEVISATEMKFLHQFDAVFSNAVLHWVKPPEQAAARIFSALKPGGRLVLEMGGRGNVTTVLRALIRAGDRMGVDLRPVVEINYFPSIPEYATVLENAGFEVSFAALFDRLTPLSEGAAGLRNWVRMFRPGVEEAVPAARQADFFGLVEQLCQPTLLINGVWHADYRRFRVVARSRAKVES
jgi:trans-aconitate methyltransferase